MTAIVADIKEKYKISYLVKLLPKTTVMVPLLQAAFTRTSMTSFHGQRRLITTLLVDISLLHP
jgi:hypothetical protein